MSLDTKTTCRICLRAEKKIARKSRSLFDYHKGLRICEKITLIADVKIQEWDQLPSRICPKCLNSLAIAYNFKVTCERSDKQLHDSSLKDGQVNNPSCETEVTENSVKEEPEVYENEVPIDDHYIYEYDVDASDVGEESKPEVDSKYDISTDQSNAPNIKLDEINYIKNKLEDPKAEIQIKQEPKIINVHVIQSTVDKIVPKSKAIDLKLECHDCGGFFKSKCKLRVHWKKVHMLEKLICSKCKRAFKTFATYNKHVKKKCTLSRHVRIEGVGKGRIFNCKNCSFSSPVKNTIITHIRSHTQERRYVCDLCGKGYTQNSSLDSHKEFAHQIYKLEITCQHCGQHIKGRNNAYKHMRKHNPGFYQCDICKAIFKKRDGLIQHIQIHYGKKKYSCDKCGKSFLTSSYLANHRKMVHNKSELPIHLCDICGYKSYRKEIITKHKLKHTDSNMSCAVCGSFHESAEKLALHQKRHFEERKYDCPHCNKKFLTHKSVGNHVRTIHKCSYNTYFKFKSNSKKESFVQSVEESMPESI